MYRNLETHRWLAWVLLIPLCAILAYSLVDTRPPFSVIKVNSILSSQPGGTAYFDIAVQRDLTRNCNAEFSRYIIDSLGYRYDVASSQKINAQSLVDMDKAMRGKLLLAVHLPDSITPGPATLSTPIEYQCSVAHMFSPIRYTMNVPFEVLRRP